MNVDKASDIEEPLLPIALPAVGPVKVKVEAGSHALLGLACVAVSALCFSFMTTFIKYETHTMSSMEAIFWRSSGAFVCNFDFSWIAVGSALLGALGQVFVFITVRQLKGVPALTIVHYFMLSSAILAFIWVVLIEQRAIVGCGVFTFLGQMFLTKGFQLEKAGIASVMRYLDVVFVFIWDWTILGEHINHWSIVGALVILTCAVVIAVRKVKGRA
ncbi:hypothetical protein BBJ28_00006080 [Nothophytophthora sp. Chile5]|nr:hypothetical protein BBJ28_00006080 [Nothophytophthora sp. Chile5]